MSLRYSRHASIPTLSPCARTCEDFLLACIVAAAKVVAEACFAFVIAATLCTEAGIGRCAFCAYAPVAVVVGIAMGGFLAGIPARGIHGREANWIWCLSSSACEDVIDRVGIA
jgi:hypothetical protein